MVSRSRLMVLFCLAFGFELDTIRSSTRIIRVARILREVNAGSLYDADETSLATASGRGQYFHPNARSVPCGTLPLVAVRAAVARTRCVHAGLCGVSEDRLCRL